MHVNVHIVCIAYSLHDVQTHAPAHAHNHTHSPKPRYHCIQLLEDAPAEDEDLKRVAVCDGSVGLTREAWRYYRLLSLSVASQEEALRERWVWRVRACTHAACIVCEQYMHTYVCTHDIHMHLCLHVCMCVCVYACMYAYMHVCMHVHTCVGVGVRAHGNRRKTTSRA